MYVRCLCGVGAVFVLCLCGVCAVFVWCLCGVCAVFVPDTRIIRGHRLPISRYHDKLSATYRGQIAALKIVDFFYNIRFS